jgi:signal transduction histidine kinase
LPSRHGLPFAEVDKGQIGQVVQNLVLNAVQAMPGGGVIRIAICHDDTCSRQMNGRRCRPATI